MAFLRMHDKQILRNALVSLAGSFQRRVVNGIRTCSLIQEHVTSQKKKINFIGTDHVGSELHQILRLGPRQHAFSELHM